MGLKYKDMVKVGDILDTNKQIIYFNDVPNLTTGLGKDLTVRHSDFTLPVIEVGQIIVKMNGWSRAFAGRRGQSNSFTCSFYEDSNATVTKHLVAWNDLCAGNLKASSKLVNEYAVSAEMKAEDTTGKVSFIYRLNNVWPVRITPASYTSDASGPMHIEVDFSVDSMDLIGIVDPDGNASMAKDVISKRNIPGVSYNKPSGINLSLPNLNISLSTPYMDVNAVLNMLGNRVYTSTGHTPLRGLTNSMLRGL